MYSKRTSTRAPGSTQTPWTSQLVLTAQKAEPQVATLAPGSASDARPTARAMRRAATTRRLMRFMNPSQSKARPEGARERNAGDYRHRRLRRWIRCLRVARVGGREGRRGWERAGRGPGRNESDPPRARWELRRACSVAQATARRPPSRTRSAQGGRSRAPARPARAYGRLRRSSLPPPTCRGRAGARGRSAWRRRRAATMRATRQRRSRARRGSDGGWSAFAYVYSTVPTAEAGSRRQG